jgi:hypothetical protein
MIDPIDWRIVSHDRSETIVVRNETILRPNRFSFGPRAGWRESDGRFVQNGGTLMRNDPNFVPGDDRFTPEATKSIANDDRFAPDLGRFDEITRKDPPKLP